MPVVFRSDGFRFFFYSNEGNPREPIHIHIEQADNEAKFWLHPVVPVAYSDAFSAKTLREVLTLIEANRAFIEKARNDFFA